MQEALWWHRRDLSWTPWPNSVQGGKQFKASLKIRGCLSNVCPDMLSDQTRCLVRRSCKSQRLHRSVARSSDTSEIAVTSIRLSMSGQTFLKLPRTRLFSFLALARWVPNMMYVRIRFTDELFGSASIPGRKVDLIDGRAAGHLGAADGLKTLSIHVCVCPHFGM